MTNLIKKLIEWQQQFPKDRSWEVYSSYSGEVVIKLSHKTLMISRLTTIIEIKSSIIDVLNTHLEVMISELNAKIKEEYEINK